MKHLSSAFVFCLAMAPTAANAQTFAEYMDRIVNARCRTGLCFGTEWGRSGLEVAGELPIGVNVGFGGRSEFNQFLTSNVSAITPTAGLRVFTLRGMVSVWGFISVPTFKADSYFRYADSSFRFTASHIQGPGFGFGFGIAQDLLQFNFTTVSLVNPSSDTPGERYDRFGPGAPVDSGWVFGFAFAPVSAIRALISAAKGNN